MNRRNRILSLVAATVLTLSLLATPATALSVPASVTCAGTMSVSPGLFAPGFGPSQSFTWDLNASCTAASPDGVETFTLAVTGTGLGWCWRSVATAGGVSLGGTTLSNFGWESAGPVHVMSGSHDGGGLGTFVGVMVVSGEADCFRDGQTDFTVSVELLIT